MGFLKISCLFVLCVECNRRHIMYHISGALFKKNLNAAKPPEQSKGLCGIKTLPVRTKTLHGIKRVPQRNHIGSCEKERRISIGPW